MPRKQWSVYEKVNAADVSTFLSDQSVMTFATTTARDAAIPSPSTGMQSAVTASPDLGAPRYWDGSAWTLVQNGASVPSVWSKATASSITSVSGTSLASGSWNQIIASAASNIVIFGLTDVRSNGSENAWNIEIGTGGSGSEVIRAVVTGQEPSAPSAHPNFQPLPGYGVYVPSGTRVAVRGNFGGTGSLVMLYADAQVSSVQVEAGSASATLSGTSWVQVSATPPIAGGVQVIGYGCASPVIFGLGTSGSEVAQTGTCAGLTGVGVISGRPLQMHIPTFTWTSGSRLAVKSTGASTYTCWIYWRESLV